MEEKDLKLETMIRGMKLAISSSVTNIENVTMRLDGHFEGLNASQLPEYQKAIDAIRAYQTGLVEHFTKKYDESER